MNTIYSILSKVDRRVFFASVVIFVICFFAILWPAPLGLADNFDYQRLLQSFGLHYPENGRILFTTIQWQYLKGANVLIQNWSSGQLFVAMAYLLSWLRNEVYFSLLTLGFFHLLFYAIAIYFFLKALTKKQRFETFLFCCILSIHLLLDTTFTSFFNSFYQESAFFIFFLLFLGCHLSDKRAFFWELVLIGLTVLSKTSNLIFLILLVPVWLKYRLEKNFFLRCISISALVLVAIVVSRPSLNLTRDVNVFHSYFYGLVTKENAATVLKDFDLPLHEYSSFININGQDLFLTFSGAKKDTFYQHVSHLQIASYYAQNPSLLFQHLAFGLAKIRSSPMIPYLVNRSEDMRTVPLPFILTIWQRIFPFLLSWWGLLLVLLQFLYFLFAKKKNTLINCMITLKILMGLTLMVALVGEGHFEFVKHAIAFQYLSSLIVFLSLFYWFARWQNFKLH